MTDVAPAAPRFDPKRRRAVLVALSLVTVLASFEATVVSTAMPTIIGELEGLPLYSWVFAVYLLTTTITMPLYGRLADLHGRRLILLVAIVVFLTGATACAFAHSMPQLILARGLQGLGAGGLLPTSLTVLGDLYGVRDRAKVQGLFSTLWGAASLLGPLLGAGMTLTFGWRSIFSINLPLGVVAFVLVASNLKESRSARSDPFDLPGALCLGLGVTCLLFSVLHGTGLAALATWTRLALAAAGLLLLAGFARLQSSRAHPLVPLSLFSRAETIAPYFCGVLLGTTIFGVDTFVPLFVQGARGGTAAAAGAVVTPTMLFWALSSSVAARLIVPLGFRATARVGAAFIVVGFTALLACALLDAPVPWISAACGVVGCGLGFMGLTQVLAIQHTTAASIRGRGHEPGAVLPGRGRVAGRGRARRTPVFRPRVPPRRGRDRDRGPAPGGRTRARGKRPERRSRPSAPGPGAVAAARLRRAAGPGRAEPFRGRLLPAAGRREGAARGPGRRSRDRDSRLGRQILTSSTRRFFARPSSVALSPTGPPSP